MRRKLCTILLLAFSLPLGSCANGPKIPICIGNLGTGFQCVDANGKPYTPAPTDVLVLTTADGAKELLDYCKIKSAIPTSPQ